MDLEPLKMKARCSFEMLGTAYPASQHHVQEDWNLVMYDILL